MRSNPEIFFSYAWGDEYEQGEGREKMVNELYTALVNDNYRVIRDKYNLEYKGFISEFMSRIGKGHCIVVAISKKYVKSPYCMFELYEIARNSNFDKHQFRSKVLPVMVEFIDFTNPAIIAEYFSFWENEYTQWDDLVKKHSGQLAGDQMQRYDKIKMIYQNFGRLTEWIIDMNALSPEVLSADNFAEIKKAIIQKGAVDPGPKPRRRVLKMPVFWITGIAVIAAIVLITFKSGGKRNSTPPRYEPTYDVVVPANEELLVVQAISTKLFGYARAKDTSLFISFKYNEANPFIEGIARVKTNGKYQWIKPDSSDAFEERFDQAEDFQNGKAKVKNGKDSFYIDLSGKQIVSSSNHTVVVKPGKGNTTGGVANTPANDSIDKPPAVKMCKVICTTSGISGVEVSVFDEKNNQLYSELSGSKDLVFDIPCYLKGEKSVAVTFKKNDKSETRFVDLKKLEIPEMFRTGP